MIVLHVISTSFWKSLSLYFLLSPHCCLSVSCVIPAIDWTSFTSDFRHTGIKSLSCKRYSPKCKAYSLKANVQETELMLPVCSASVYLHHCNVYQGRDVLELSVLSFRCRFNGSPCLEIVRLFSAVHPHPPVVICSYYIHMKVKEQSHGCSPPFVSTTYWQRTDLTLLLWHVAWRFKLNPLDILFFSRCVVEVQIWPFGSGGPVDIQEWEVPVLPQAHADECRGPDFRSAERRPRSHRLRSLQG